MHWHNFIRNLTWVSHIYWKSIIMDTCNISYLLFVTTLSILQVEKLTVDGATVDTKLGQVLLKFLYNFSVTFVLTKFCKKSLEINRTYFGPLEYLVQKSRYRVEIAWNYAHQWIDFTKYFQCESKILSSMKKNLVKLTF